MTSWLCACVALMFGFLKQLTGPIDSTWHMWVPLPRVTTYTLARWLGTLVCSAWMTVYLWGVGDCVEAVLLHSHMKWVIPLCWVERHWRHCVHFEAVQCLWLASGGPQETFYILLLLLLVVTFLRKKTKVNDQGLKHPEFTFIIELCPNMFLSKCRRHKYATVQMASWLIDLLLLRETLQPPHFTHLTQLVHKPRLKPLMTHHFKVPPIVWVQLLI